MQKMHLIQDVLFPICIFDFNVAKMRVRTIQLEQSVDFQSSLFPLENEFGAFAYFFIDPFLHRRLYVTLPINNWSCRLFVLAESELLP